LCTDEGVAGETADVAGVVAGVDAAVAPATLAVGATVTAGDTAVCPVDATTPAPPVFVDAAGAAVAGV
jgi:hypothetical protein